MTEPVDFFPAVVTAYPDDEDHAPLLQDPVHARLAPARDVVEGDLILAEVTMAGADYFNDQYTAHPEEYRPDCQCGVCCCLADETGAVVVLSNGDHWETCDRGRRARPGPHRPRRAARSPAVEPVAAAMTAAAFTPSLPGTDTSVNLEG